MYVLEIMYICSRAAPRVSWRLDRGALASGTTDPSHPEAKLSVFAEQISPPSDELAAHCNGKEDGGNPLEFTAAGTTGAAGGGQPSRGSMRIEPITSPGSIVRTMMYLGSQPKYAPCGSAASSM